MIDPQNPINFKRSLVELESILLFLIVVAGKTAKVQAPALKRFLADIPEGYGTFTPFELIRHYSIRGKLVEQVRKHRLGCYNQIARSMKQLALSRFNLKTVSLEELVEVYRIGRKSASCFIMWTRPNTRLAGLDTHLLKYMAKFVPEGYKMPKSTPSSKKQYDYLENLWLAHCDEIGKDPTFYDLEIWKFYANKEGSL